ncbi:hypothetical protein [Flexithrix dorotheae]|uniref:hypothetical protein n=1 Tax=Flexithrix dorotheae TaxID=70993 RepID=UPI000362D7D0|nr:hypothetical protein [Flexithrix dorotheae]
MAVNIEDKRTEMELNEYQMTYTEYQEIADLSEGNNLGSIPNSILFEFWERLGDKYGFRWETAQASTKGGRYFLAAPNYINLTKELEQVIELLPEGN